jgi:hypothetical protein
MRCARACSPIDFVIGQKPDFLDWPSVALRPAAASRNDQSLTEWMRMPGGPGAVGAPLGPLGIASSNRVELEPNIIIEQRHVRVLLIELLQSGF